MISGTEQSKNLKEKLKFRTVWHQICQQNMQRHINVYMLSLKSFHTH